MSNTRKRTLTLREAAAMLGVGIRTLQDGIERGLLPGVRIHRETGHDTWVIPRPAIERFLETGRFGEPEPVTPVMLHRREVPMPLNE